MRLSTSNLSITYSLFWKITPCPTMKDEHQSDKTKYEETQISRIRPYSDNQNLNRFLMKMKTVAEFTFIFDMLFSKHITNHRKRNSGSRWTVANQLHLVAKILVYLRRSSFSLYCYRISYIHWREKVRPKNKVLQNSYPFLLYLVFPSH